MLKLKKGYLIKNEMHSLLPQQEALMNEYFQEWTTVNVPACGWALEEMKSISEILQKKLSVGNRPTHAAVFLSPIPFFA